MSESKQTTKKITVLGRARSGKSFLISRFVQNSTRFVDAFTYDGSDKTVCNIHIKITRHTEKDEFVWFTNFGDVFSDSENPIIEVLDSKTSKSTMTCKLDDHQKLHTIETAIRGLRTHGFDTPHSSKPIVSYFQLEQQASDFCKELMDECKIDTLEIIDTPGVSGDVDVYDVPDADIYIFVLRRDNEDDAKTIAKIVDKLKAQVGSSKVLFFYHVEVASSDISNDDDYDKDVRYKAKQCMLDFDRVFDGFIDILRNKSVISVDMDVLHPSDNCIAFPTLSTKSKTTIVDSLFISDLKENLLKCFRSSVSDKDFIAICKEYGEEARSFFSEKMKSIPAHVLASTSGQSEDVELVNGVCVHRWFKTWGHDRVMSKDAYAIKQSVSECIKKEKNILLDYFSTFVSDDYKNIDDAWKVDIIRYAYRKLNESISNAWGLTYSTHCNEDDPPVTMLAEESILAGLVLRYFGADKPSRALYATAFADGGVESTSWKFVYLDHTAFRDAYKKLEIIRDSLCTIPVNDLTELVLCRYVGGLCKFTQYRMFVDAGFTEQESTELVKSLPFAVTSDAK